MTAYFQAVDYGARKGTELIQKISSDVKNVK